MAFTPNGSRRLVDSGAEVLSWDGSGLCVGYVGGIRRMGSKPVLTITAGGHHVESTADHEFYTDNGWKRAGALHPGEKVLLCMWSGNASESANLFAGLHDGSYAAIKDWHPQSDDECGAAEEGERYAQATVCASLASDERAMGQRKHDGDNDDGKTYPRVYFAVIESIVPSGIKPVCDLINVNPTHAFFANGFLVSNCEWGSSAMTKVRQLPEEWIYGEIEWMGRNRTGYCDGADANFGILKRDVDIAKRLAETKVKYGYPQTYRTSFAKNSNEAIWTIANILHGAGMLKSVTLAMQPVEIVTFINRPTIRANAGGGWGLNEEDLRKELSERWPSVEKWNIPVSEPHFG